MNGTLTGGWGFVVAAYTVSALMLAAYTTNVIAALRKFVEEPGRRATWSAVATIIGYVDVPIVYFSVKWWNSLHQQQSSASTVSREFAIPMLINFAGMLLLIAGVAAIRTRVAALHLEQEMPEVIA